MTWSPLACGLITGKYSDGVPDCSRASMKVSLRVCEHLSTFPPCALTHTWLCVCVRVISGWKSEYTVKKDADNRPKSKSSIWWLTGWAAQLRSLRSVRHNTPDMLCCPSRVHLQGFYTQIHRRLSQLSVVIAVWQWKLCLCLWMGLTCHLLQMPTNQLTPCWTAHRAEVCGRPGGTLWLLLQWNEPIQKHIIVYFAYKRFHAHSHSFPCLSARIVGHHLINIYELMKFSKVLYE